MKFFILVLFSFSFFSIYCMDSKKLNKREKVLAYALNELEIRYKQQRQSYPRINSTPSMSVEELDILLKHALQINKDLDAIIALEKEF